MNGNMNLGKRVTLLEKDGGAEIKKEISDLQDAVVTVQNSVTIAQKDIDALETKVNSGHVYSTVEKVVGTWIDGRSIYEKTWQIENVTAANNWDVTNADFENIAFVTSACLYDTDSENPRFVSVSTRKLTSTSIRFYTNSEWASIDAYTLQYVKTQ